MDKKDNKFVFDLFKMKFEGSCSENAATRNLIVILTFSLVLVVFLVVALKAYFPLLLSAAGAKNFTGKVIGFFRKPGSP